MGTGVGVDVGGGALTGSMARFGCAGGSSLSNDMRLDVLRSCAGGRDNCETGEGTGGLCC